MQMMVNRVCERLAADAVVLGTDVDLFVNSVTPFAGLRESAAS